MTATDELHRLLDERGMEWEDGGMPSTNTTFIVNGVAWHAMFRDGGIELHCEPVTPEQAIAATLGSSNCTDGERTNGTCVPVLDSERDNQPYLKPRFVCSECGCQLTESRLGKVWQNYCPNCGRRIEP